MKLIKTRTAAVIMAALMAAACGQKPSTIRESSASRARDFQFDAPAEPTEAARGADPAAEPADSSVPETTPAPDPAAAPQPAGDATAAVAPPAPDQAPQAPASRRARS